MQLPKDFIDKMNTLLGDDAPNFFAALDKPSEKAITVNFDRLKENIFEDLCDFEISKIPMIENGYFVNNLKFSKNILSHLGIIYSQEPSAMYPVELLDVQPGDYVLDVCASPGGKSVQILEKLKGEGFLLSNEIVYNRTKILYENLNRMGFKNFAISCNSPEDLSNCKNKFDKIIIDAPCGGEGMFRKENFDFHAYHPESIDSNSDRQFNILENVKHLLRDGGRLVYSTCTYDVRENEAVVNKFLTTNTNFKLVHIGGFEDVTSSGIDVGNNTNLCYRRYPHKHPGEGQFMAVLEKLGDEDIFITEFNNNKFAPISNKDKKVLSDNLTAICDIKSKNIVKKDNNYYLLPEETLSLENLNIVCIGCVIGNYNGKAFKINHNFYHTYGDDFKLKANLEKEDILKYLHGEEIDTESPNGICVVSYKNMPLGGGKVVNGKLKNYYPKELRI